MPHPAQQAVPSDREVAGKSKRLVRKHCRRDGPGVEAGGPVVSAKSFHDEAVRRRRCPYRPGDERATMARLGLNRFANATTKHPAAAHSISPMRSSFVVSTSRTGSLSSAYLIGFRSKLVFSKERSDLASLLPPTHPTPTERKDPPLDIGSAHRETFQERRTTVLLRQVVASLSGRPRHLAGVLKQEEETCRPPPIFSPSAGGPRSDHWPPRLAHTST